LEQQKKVTTIPASISKFTAAPIDKPVKRKVAGYARVSTDHDEQFTSYEAQIDYYTKYIQSRDDWEFVKVYTDEGISGTGTKKRVGFRTMIDDALAGKIDLIVTKSVSRFARNTVDSLSTIRELKDHGVECYFEKENIWTFDGKGELLITIMSSLAQEESRSISENCTWGQRKRFADGKVSVPFSRFLGYDRGPNGELVVNPEEAKTIKEIYRLFLQGQTPYGIAKQLTSEGILTPGGKTKWSVTTVKGILKNLRLAISIQSSGSINVENTEKSRHFKPLDSGGFQCRLPEPSLFLCLVEASETTITR
jgi:site-specific DNA recombinase